MSCLVVMELEGGKPSRSSLATITAARKLSDNVDLLLLEAANKEHIANLNSEKCLRFSLR